MSCHMFMNFYVSKELENHCLTAIANIYILHTTDHYKLKICMILVYLNVELHQYSIYYCMKTNRQQSPTYIFTCLC